MHVFFNTPTFDAYVPGSGLKVTTDREEAELLVLGARRPDYSTFPALRAVYRFGVGTDNIDFPHLEGRGVAIHFPSPEVLGVMYDSVADFTVLGALTVLLPGCFGQVDGWRKTERRHLANLTALVIGLGNIGLRVAERLRSFMRVTTYDAATDPEEVLRGRVEEADVITVHVPLTSETTGMFDAEKLSWVRDGALLVNTSRGALFDEDALYDKLSSTSCRAFFDVFWNEPYDGKLKALGKECFFMTPHSASSTSDFVRAGFGDVVRLAEGF